MTKRVVGSLLVGLGLYLVVVAVTLAFVVTPTLRRIPYSLKTTTIVTEAPNATFAQARVENFMPSIEIQRADVRATTRIYVDGTAAAALTGSLADQTVIWNVLQRTERVDTGERISDSNSRIALDRSTGAAVEWTGQCLADEPGETCEAGTIAYAGQLYQFPFDTQKATYRYFDPELRKALPIKYAGTDTIKGVRAYRFEQVIAEQPLEASPLSTANLLARFAPGATSATMLYRNHRSVWVEPVTGAIVAIEDKPRRRFVPNVGEPTVLFDGTFYFSPQTQRAIIDEASSGRAMILALSRYVPIGLVLLGLLTILFGYRMIRRSRSV